jgi:hypothetical protein
LIGVEPEIIKCGIANSIGVLVLRQRFAGPGDGAAALIYCPRHTAVTLVVKGAIVSPAGLLRWRVEADISYVHSWSHRHSEGLNSAIQVLVVERVLVVPNSNSWIGHFVTHKPDAIVSRVGLDLIDRGARDRPSRDGRSHPHCSTNGRK